MWSSITEYLSVNLKDYENIGIDFNINIFILALAAALCVASFVINHKRSLIVGTVKQLFRHNATSEDSAKTLEELGLMDCRGIKSALNADTQLRRLVARAGEKPLSYEEYIALPKDKRKLATKTDFETARFYIPEASLDRAKRIYNSYNTSLFKTALLCVLYIIVAVSLILISPEVLNFINSMLG